MDTSDSAKFKISGNSSGLGTNDYMTCTTGGLWTMGASAGTQVHLVNGNLRQNNASGSNSYHLIDGLGASDKAGVELLTAGTPKWFVHNNPSNSNNLEIIGADASTLFAQVTALKSVVLGSAAIATNATDGFLYIASCAGTPTGVPTTFTGRNAMVYDTSANKLWIYNGSWRSTTLT